MSDRDTFFFFFFVYSESDQNRSSNSKNYTLCTYIDVTVTIGTGVAPKVGASDGGLPRPRLERTGREELEHLSHVAGRGG